MPLNRPKPWVPASHTMAKNHCSWASQCGAWDWSSWTPLMTPDRRSDKVSCCYRGLEEPPAEMFLLINTIISLARPEQVPHCFCRYHTWPWQVKKMPLRREIQFQIGFCNCWWSAGQTVSHYFTPDSWTSFWCLQVPGTSAAPHMIPGFEFSVLKMHQMYQSASMYTGQLKAPGWPCRIMLSFLII